jgi:hypothetical protein
MLRKQSIFSSFCERRFRAKAVSRKGAKEERKGRKEK